MKQLDGVTHTVDAFGGRAPLATALRHEQAHACEAIFLLTTARAMTRPPADDVTALIRLLRTLATATSQGGVQKGTLQTSALHVLVALATVLAPPWGAAAAAPGGDDSGLPRLLRSSEVTQAVSSLPGDVGGFAAALRLVLGVATIVCFDKGDVREVAAAVPLVAAALDAGAFAFLVRLSPSPLKPRAANFGPF